MTRHTRMFDNPVVVFEAETHDESIRVRTGALLSIAEAEVVDLAERGGRAVAATPTVAPTRSRRPQRRRPRHAAGAVLSPRRRPQLADLAARWRVALVAADEALSAAARGGFGGLGAAELGRRRRRLEQEWLTTDRLLGALGCAALTCRARR